MRLGRSLPWMVLLLGVAAAIGYIVLAIIEPHAAAGGWLVAFLFWSSVAVGSLIALTIYRLTGGRWAMAYWPVFAPAAATVPIFGIIFIPVLVLLPEFYPWAAGHPVEPDIRHFYLNAPFYIGRSALAFFGWTLTFFAVTRLPGWLGALAAGAGLAFHGLIIGAVGLDWIQSIEPLFFSTSFGASFAFTQLICAFAWAALVGPIRERDRTGDLGGLLLATVLGLLYTDFMAVLILWYGDRPDKLEWLYRRDHLPWDAVAIAAFLLGCVTPIFSLFPARLRSSPLALRIIGGITLMGVALYFAWMVGPEFGAISLIAMLLAVIAMGALFVALVSNPWVPSFLLPRRVVRVE